MRYRHRVQRSKHGSVEEGHPKIGEPDRHEKVFSGAHVWGERTLLLEAALVLNDPASLWHDPVLVIGGPPRGVKGGFAYRNQSLAPTWSS